MIDEGFRRATTGVSQASMAVFAPRRSVIIDMIMVQFISVILTSFGVLVFAGNTMSTTDVTVYLIAIFVSLIFITSLYARISR